VSDRLEIHIVSDSTGDTAARVGRAAQSQFVDTEVEMIRHARVQTREQLARALESATNRRAAVFYTLVDPSLREAMVEIAHAGRLVVHDVLGPALNAITTASGREASLVPGRSAPLDAQYFRRIAAIEFAVKHDDGRGADDLHQADIVLIGVSRTSKTPTSMHLGYLGCSRSSRGSSSASPSTRSSWPASAAGACARWPARGPATPTWPRSTRSSSSPGRCTSGSGARSSM
jgi:[pyruvate, water dikinase]-phosphate phosphotransferase / [pyruvate, water dikinase] kinase